MKKTLFAAILMAAVFSNAFAEETETPDTTEQVVEEVHEVQEEEQAKPLRKGLYLDDISLGIGNLTQFVNKLQTNESGSKNIITFLPYIQLSGKIPFTERFSFIPEFTLTIPKKSNDDLITRLTYIVIGNVAYDWRRFTFLAGMGLSFTRLTADGGYKELNNGNGYDYFPVPKGTRTSSNIIFHLGTSYEFRKNMSAKVGLHFYNLEDSDERAVSYTIGLTYHFGDMIKASGAK
jgi:opacity protein-like surface antigen